MNLRSAVPLAAAVFGAACLLVLDGDVAVPRATSRPSVVPPALADRVRLASEELSHRSAVLAGKPEVARSLAGGGIAVNRLVLFSAARQAMEGAPPGSWIALTDPAGAVQAWWGDAPASLAGLVSADGFGARWSATTLTLVYRRPVGEGRSSAFVYSARSFPVEAPDFGRALGLSGAALSWVPVSPRSGTPVLLDMAGRPLVGGRDLGTAQRGGFWRGASLAGVLVATLLLLGRARDPLRMGAALAFAFLAVEAAEGSHALFSGRLLAMALGPLLLPLLLVRRGLDARPPGLRPAHRLVLGYGAAVLAAISATAVSPPQLGSPPHLSTLGRPAALTALIVAAVALAASGRRGGGSRQWMTVALLVTSAAIVAGLAPVSPSPLHLAGVLVLFLAAFELWSRAVASSPPAEALALPRLLVGAALLALLLVAPVSEHQRAAGDVAVSRGIVLPDPSHASAAAVSAAERAAQRVRRFDLGRDLPTGPDGCDLSDLAYRIWKDGEKLSGAPELMAYEVSDSAGSGQSGFSLIPDWNGPEPREGPVRIDRHRVALVRRLVPLSDGGRRWGSVTITVADWPAWDPLPPRIEVYRRLVLGESGALSVSAPRPVLASYGRDAEPRDEGPILPAALKERLRRSTGPVEAHLHFRGEELWGQIRPTADGYQLVAVPGPDTLGRFLTAALLIPGIFLLYGAVGLLLLWRIVAMENPEAGGGWPASRGRSGDGWWPSSPPASWSRSLP